MKIYSTGPNDKGYTVLNIVSDKNSLRLILDPEGFAYSITHASGYSQLEKDNLIFTDEPVAEAAKEGALSET
jgi:hypothetical protein